MTTFSTRSLANTRKALSVMMMSVFWSSFWMICTALALSSPVTVTVCSSGVVIEAVGHQRVSRDSMVGLKLCLLARRFMIGSRVAAGPRDEEEVPGAARLGRFERSSAAVGTGLYEPGRRL